MASVAESMKLKIWTGPASPGLLLLLLLLLLNLVGSFCSSEGSGEAKHEHVQLQRVFNTLAVNAAGEALDDYRLPTRHSHQAGPCSSPAGALSEQHG